MSHSARPLRFWVYTLQFVLSSFLLLACYHPPVLDAGFVQEEIAELPLILPSAIADTLYADLNDPAAVLSFYEQRNYRPGWVDNARSDLTDSLILFVRNSRYYGLHPGNYHLDEFFAAAGPAWREDIRLRKDILLTDAFLSVARDLHCGRLRNPNRHCDSLAMASLKKVVTQGGVQGSLESLQPEFAQYHWLQKGLQNTIDTADSVERAWLLRGMTVDTIALHRKVQTIEINLERWRRESSTWGERYILVNIPSFMVEVFDSNMRVIESRAIVGKREKMTPQFSSTVQCFITYPYWNVPRKISIEEFLPAIQRDTSFIRRNNFDVLNRRGKLLHPDSVQWQTFHKDNFPVILRQREGPENSLGIIKFQFDNPYAVFIHDTNARRLFRNKVRALSHGCIRMEKATKLGHYLLTGDVKKESPILESYLEQKLRHTVDLPRPIPIHIRYFTAAADVYGKVVILDDIYDKDRNLIDSLYVTKPAIARAIPNDGKP